MTKQLGRVLCAVLLWSLCSVKCSAFALLGPYAPWMDTAKSYRMTADIGGPMDIGEEYRWNVPVLTYGFDQSFINFFGYQGTQAVDQAFQILNNLPPASQIDLTHYRTDTRKGNLSAGQLGLSDLKSWTLSIMVEQLGLAWPDRWIYCLRDLQVNAATTNYLVIQRSFDPETLAPSDSVDGVQYTYQFSEWPDHSRGDAIEYVISPTGYSHTVAGYTLSPGLCFTDLTRDDVGGLRYLLMATNINMESVIAGVSGIDGSSNFVATALRPGVEKIAFLKLQLDPSKNGFVSITNVFTDSYLSNGIVSHQTVQRVISEPDFLFTAADLGASSTIVERPDTSTWINNSVLAGDPTPAGPGVITPPQTAITFNTLTNFWGSFDNSTNYPIIYDGNPIFPPVLNSVTFSTNGVIQVNFATGTKQTNTLEYSTDLASWTALSTWTNISGNISFTDTISTNAGARFYRVIGE